VTAILFSGNQILTAQSIQYGKITGTVSDEGGVPIPGVRVDIASDALISGTRTTTTSENGTYLFLSLPVGTYNVSASLTGFRTIMRENIQTSAGVVTTVDFKLEMGAVEEQITVTAAGPIIDRKASTVETKFDEQQLQRLPTGREPFYDLTLTAPGMFEAGKDSAWLPSPTAFGSATNENAFLVDGVNATDPRGGSWGTLVNVNYDAVEQVRVIALGSKAEYGSSTGVAVDVLTKSGGNELHGRGSVYSQVGNPANNTPTNGNDLGRDWLLLDPTSSLLSKTETDREFAFTLGGPIMKNRIWFFTAADLSNEDLKKPLWPVVLQTKNRFFDFKVSAEPFKNQQAWFAYHIERNDVAGDTWGDNVPWDSTLQFGTAKDNNTFSSQWQWSATPKTLFSAKYLGFWTGWDPNIPADAPSNPGYINWWKIQEFGVNGNFPYIEGHDATRHTVQGDVSTYVENFLGQQDIKFGVQYTTGHGTDLGGYFQGFINYAYPYRSSQDIQYIQDSYGDTGMLWYVLETHLPPFETVRNFKQAGAFVDNQWTPTPRLTFNLGLRFDNMTNRYGTGHVFAQPSDPHADISNLQIVSDRQGTGNVFDFNNWSPRIGGTYSLTGDGKTVMRANFGRYFSPVGLENLRRYGPNMPIRSTHTLFYSVPWDQVDLNHNNFIDPEEVPAAARLLKDLAPYDDFWSESDPSWSAQVAPGTKNQFLDQWTVNFEREIIPDLSFSATFIHKRTGNILVNMPINRATGLPFEYERIPFTTSYGQQVELFSIVKKDYNGDGVFDLDDVQFVWDNTDYVVQNLGVIDGHKPERIYKGLQFVVNKRFSNRAQLLGSFLYSMSNGPANRNNFQDWNIEGPEIMDTTSFGSLNNTINNLEGPLPFTPKYEFKLSGSYFLPKIDTDLGVRLRYSSGRPYWFLEDIPTLAPWGGPDNGILDTGVPPTIVGVDPNHPVFLPASTILDFRLAKVFNIARSQSMQFSLDVFNIFNAGVVTNADYQFSPGKVTAVTSPSRKFRAGLSYQF
jgi:outer membrane receptor protein involved in Fe transport